LWNNGQTGLTANGFAAGNHTMTITDGNGCELEMSYSITEPTALSLTTSTTAAACNGLGSGTATVTPIGGTGPYTYLWNDPLGQTSQTATGLTANSYTVIVTDANSCTENTSVSISEPSSLNISIPTTTEVSCNGGSDGTATVLVTDGSPGYTYLWSDGQTTITATGLSANVTYTVTATDANGCTISATTSLSSPGALTIDNISTTDVNCHGGNDGTAGIVVVGGTPDYTIAWSNSTAGNSTGSLSAGLYSVTATDAAGCSQSQSFSIAEPISPVQVSIQTTDALCNGATSGEVAAIASGGTPASTDYSYLWSTGATTGVVDSIGAGTYSVEITDSLGCTATATAIVGEATDLSLSILSSSNVTCNG
ncbi:MAG: hypothetical protein GY819_04940, partial [Planctomycetaceae bacterium]|nr:hypothetical protein [Planctomycetaceae bacterium]